MARGGARPGAGRPLKPPQPRNRKRTGRPAGRPKGAISKSTRAILEAAAAKSITPLECILQNMRRHLRARRWDEAERSAALAAPYMHPRLAATAVAVKRSIAEQMMEMTDEELAASIKELEDELATVKTRGSA